MGALPKKKLTRARKRRRLASQKLRPLNPAFCSRCRSAKMPHTACPQCGYYRGMQVVGVEG